MILMLTPGHLSTSTKFQLSFRRTILHRIRAATQPGPTRPGQPELRSTTRLSDLCWSARAHWHAAMEPLPRIFAVWTDKDLPKMRPNLGEPRSLRYVS